MTTGPTDVKVTTAAGGPDGMPLALKFNEGLGCTGRADEPRWCQRAAVFALLAGRHHGLPCRKAAASFPQPVE